VLLRFGIRILRSTAGCIIDTSGAPRKSRTCDDHSVEGECPHTTAKPGPDLVITGSTYVYRAEPPTNGSRIGRETAG
jgi:hypothetical protein